MTLQRFSRGRHAVIWSALNRIDEAADNAVIAAAVSAVVAGDDRHFFDIARQMMVNANLMAAR